MYERVKGNDAARKKGKRNKPSFRNYYTPAVLYID